MQKAYDFKEFLNRLKDEGVELGEETAKTVIKTLFPFLTESAQLSENKIDDFLAVAYPIAQAKLLEAAEDINKADNPA